MTHTTNDVGTLKSYLIAPRPRFSSLLLLGFIQVSCGNLNSSREANPIRQSDDERFFSDAYFLADNQCDVASRDDQQVGKIQVNRWQDGNLQLVDAHLETTYADFSSSIISNAYSNFHSIKKCEKNGEDKDCSNTTEYLGTPTALGICQSTGAYPRTSFEGIGTAAASLIEQAQQFYLSTDGHRTDHSKNVLLVLPKFEEQVTEVYSDGQRATHSTFETNNLAYSGPNKESDHGIFFIYPKGGSARSQELFGEFNLWEVPFAQIHEVGHHIFHHHAGEFENSAGGTLSAQPFWERLASNLLGQPAIGQLDAWENARDRALLSRLGRSPQVSSYDYWRATNEGFADLFAFYALGGQGNLLAGVTCLEHSREISSGKMIDGSGKILTRFVLDQFEGQINSSFVEPCQDVDFQDIHTLGAIAAYGINRLWDITLKNDSDAKAALLLKWADQLGTTRSAISMDMASANGGGLYPWLKDAALVIKGNRSALSDQECSVLMSVFPAYDELWADQFSCHLEEPISATNISQEETYAVENRRGGPGLLGGSGSNMNAAQPKVEFLTTDQLSATAIQTGSGLL